MDDLRSVGVPPLKNLVIRPQGWFATSDAVRRAGPVEVRGDGHELPLGGPKQRALLAILLLQANEVVSRDRLADGLWGERPPASVEHTLDNYVSRLRKALGRDRLIRRPPGYVLRVEPDELDRDRSISYSGRDARRLLAATQTRPPLRCIRRWASGGDRLWRTCLTSRSRRGERPPGGMAAPRARGTSRGRSRLGAAAELVPELERLVRDEPFRERPLGQLMLALYRAGRQAEALSVFQHGRLRFAEELGLELGPQVVELQRKILAHDASLSTAAAAVPAGRRVRRRRRWLLAYACRARQLPWAWGALDDLATGAGVEPGAATPEIVGLDWESGGEGRVAGWKPQLWPSGNAVWTADPNSGPSPGSTSPPGRSGIAFPWREPGRSCRRRWVGVGCGRSGRHVSRVDPPTGTVTQRLPLG